MHVESQRNRNSKCYKCKPRWRFDAKLKKEHCANIACLINVTLVFGGAWEGFMVGMMKAGAAGALVLGLLASCDNGPSAVETRDRTAETAAPASGSVTAAEGGQGEAVAAPVALHRDGKPVWAAS